MRLVHWYVISLLRLTCSHTRPSNSISAGQVDRGPHYHLRNSTGHSSSARDKQASKLVMGVDSFKPDFAERIPVKGIQCHDHSSPERMHNYYALLYNRMVSEALVNRVGHAQGLLFGSTAPGNQAYPVPWGGDCESTFEAMAESLRGGLGLMLSRYVFWASGIGGFEGTPPPALYKRCVQFGLLSSH